jgi:hypothetical protein
MELERLRSIARLVEPTPEPLHGQREPKHSWYASWVHDALETAGTVNDIRGVAEARGTEAPRCGPRGSRPSLPCIGTQLRGT